MTLQQFFDSIPRITLHDPLAEFLGAARDGRLEYGYGDAVRFAGHACPTVAMAYALTVKGLQALCPDALPERGAFLASFPQAHLRPSGTSSERCGSVGCAGYWWTTGTTPKCGR